MSTGQEFVPPSVIFDKEHEKEDDLEFFVQSSNLPLDSPLHNSETNSQSMISKPEGALARTLLETKEKFVGKKSVGDDGDMTKDVTIDEAQRMKEREGMEKEVKTLQGSIQSLCQSANPLGKMMDYVQVSFCC